MELATMGLGRMGVDMASRLLRGGHRAPGIGIAIGRIRTGAERDPGADEAARPIKPRNLIIKDLRSYSQCINTLYM